MAIVKKKYYPPLITRTRSNIVWPAANSYHGDDGAQKKNILVRQSTHRSPRESAQPPPPWGDYRSEMIEYLRDSSQQQRSSSYRYFFIFFSFVRLRRRRDRPADNYYYIFNRTAVFEGTKGYTISYTWWCSYLSTTAYILSLLLLLLSSSVRIDLYILRTKQ